MGRTWTKNEDEGGYDDKKVEDKMAGDRQGQMESDQVQDDGKVRDPNYTGGEYPSNMGHTQNVAGLTGDEDTESK